MELNFQPGDIIGDIKIIGKDLSPEKVNKKHGIYYLVKCAKCGTDTDRNGNKLSMRADNIKKYGCLRYCKCKATKPSEYYITENIGDGNPIPSNIKNNYVGFENEYFKITGFSHINDRHIPVWFIHCKVCGQSTDIYGNRKTINGDNIKRAKSCGCARFVNRSPMSKKEDFDWEMLPHVGGIDHIEKIESKNNHSMYRIYCENGIIVERSSKATKEIYNKALNGEPLPWDKPPVNDLTGQKFNKLTVLRPLSKKEVEDNNLQSGVYSQQWWLCQCECGNYKYVTTHGLLSENVKSCGCLSIEKTIERNTTHNMYSTEIYNIWDKLKDRCLNPNSENYENYGGRGVFIADEWKYDPEDPEKGFKKFYDDMYEDFEKKVAENPGEIISLDRIDNQFGYYGPGQVQWSTPTEQARNTSKNIIVEYLGKEYSIQDLIDELEPYFNEELTRDIFYNRIISGWSINEALSIPIGVRRAVYDKNNNIQIPVSFKDESVSPNLGYNMLPKKSYPTREEYEKYWNERGMDINTGKKISELDQVHLPKFTIIDED